MPGLKVAVANGNWSSTSTWSGGVLPVAGDIVASNGFTVTIDQNINVDSLTNAAQSIVTATAAMTGYSTPTGYLVEASNYQEPAWQAFDRNGSSRAWVQNLPLWISYTFPSAIIIDSYRLDMYTSNLYAMQNFTFEGWNGTSWVVLHTVTGNSLTTYISPSIGNTTAYIKYRFHCTSTSGTAGVIYQEISLYELGYGSAAVAGGGFIVDATRTLTFTSSVYSISAGTVTCLTYSGNSSTTLTISAGVGGISSVSATNRGCIEVTGGGNVNITANLNYLQVWATNNSRLRLVSAGTVNITGALLAGGQGGYAVHVVGNNITLNVVGNLFGGGDNDAYAITVGGLNNTITVVGNLYPSGANRGGGINMASTGTLNVTGNVYGGYNPGQPGYGILLAAVCTCNITGNITLEGTQSAPAFYSNVASYVNHIGTISSSVTTSTSQIFISLNASAINILTGPFISSPTGGQPLYVSRMHYRRTMGSYFEFRDNSTNGALPPAVSAPATRLVSPDTVADSPIPANVRQGTSYAAGSQTGTMIVPSRDNVAKGVLVDNTTGTAILDADAIWAVPLTSINTLNSIGRRVKNAATVETTGAQIQTTLNNNE
jgi:hypothetical protein